MWDFFYPAGSMLQESLLYSFDNASICSFYLAIALWMRILRFSSAAARLLIQTKPAVFFHNYSEPDGRQDKGRSAARRPVGYPCAESLPKKTVDRLPIL